LRESVGVDNFVNHHRAGVDLFGEALSAIQIARENARR
jgi:hypothetical protein